MIEVRRLGPTIGAEVTGVDVKALDEKTFGVIYRAWLDYNVICVRAQNPGIDDSLAYRAEYRHQWRKGDIVIWDNRCLYHMATGDYPPEEDRIHWRVSICEPAAAA